MRRHKQEEWMLNLFWLISSVYLISANNKLLIYNNITSGITRINRLNANEGLANPGMNTVQAGAGYSRVVFRVKECNHATLT